MDQRIEGNLLQLVRWQTDLIICGDVVAIASLVLSGKLAD